MNLLLDTHSFIWFVEDHPSLSPHARMLIEEPNNDVFLSITYPTAASNNVFQPMMGSGVDE